MTDQIEFQNYVFAEVSVFIVRETALEEVLTVEDYPHLLGMSDRELDSFLHWCWRKSFQIFNENYGLDFCEMERLADWYKQP